VNLIFFVAFIIKNFAGEQKATPWLTDETHNLVRQDTIPVSAGFSQRLCSRIALFRSYAGEN
jgi:hypothetical protein